MERNLYTDELEQLLKEKSDEFKMYPSKRVWSSLYNNLHPGKTWPSLAISLILILTLIFTGYWNSFKNTKVKLISNNIASSSNNIKVSSPLNLNNSNSITILTNNKLAKTKNQNAVIKNYFSNPNATLKSENNSSSINDIKNEHQNLIINNLKINEVVIGDKLEKNKEVTTITSHLIFSDTVNAKLNNTNQPVTNTNIEEKQWIENYAFYNKLKRKKWKDRLSAEIYITPSTAYRKWNSNAFSSPIVANFIVSNTSSISDNIVHQKAGLGLEAGFGLVYTFAKNIKLKAGLQANYTSYVINGVNYNHPISSSLLLNDLSSGTSYLVSKSSTLSNENISTNLSTKTFNKTYQISLPIGIAFKLSGNKQLEWLAGATLQPTLILGGKANLLSYDGKNYISDASLIRKWNVNSTIETYLNYKLGNYSLQLGPQFRYQLKSTYKQQFTTKENLFSTGIKVGLLKNF